MVSAIPGQGEHGHPGGCHRCCSSRTQEGTHPRSQACEEGEDPRDFEEAQTIEDVRSRATDQEPYSPTNDHADAQQGDGGEAAVHVQGDPTGVHQVLSEGALQLLIVSVCAVQALSAAGDG